MENFKIRFKFKKINEFKYLSHLETVRLLMIAIRRAKIPIKYSEGFNPNPKLNLSFPIPVGLGSFAEYADMEIYEKVSPDVLVNCLNKNFGSGLQVIQAVYHKEKLPSLMADISLIKYVFKLNFKTCSQIEDYKNALQAIKEDTNTIWKAVFTQQQTNTHIVYLTIFGYTKVLNNNKIFKFNDFFINLKILSNNKSADIMDFFKEEAFVIRGDVLKTPIDIV